MGRKELHLRFLSQQAIAETQAFLQQFLVNVRWAEVNPNDATPDGEGLVKHNLGVTGKSKTKTASLPLRNLFCFVLELLYLFKPLH